MVGGFSLVTTVLLVAGACAGAEQVTGRFRPLPDVAGAAAARFAFAINEPRLSPNTYGWILTRPEPARPGPIVGLEPCTLVMHRLTQGQDGVTLQVPASVVLPRTGTMLPHYALHVRDGGFDIAYSQQSSAISTMGVGTIDWNMGKAPTRLHSLLTARQFVEGKEVPSADRYSPSSLSFVRAGEDKSRPAVCGVGTEHQVTLLVRSRLKAEPDCWAAARILHRPMGDHPRAVWLTADRILLAWSASSTTACARRVVLGVVSKSAAGGREDWELAERQVVHTGPVAGLDIALVGKRVVLAILELAEAAPRVVVYEADEKVEAWRTAGAMPLAADGLPLDVSLDNSGKSLAASLFTGRDKGYLVLVQPLRLGKFEPLGEAKLVLVEKEYARLRADRQAGMMEEWERLIRQE